MITGCSTTSQSDEGSDTESTGETVSYEFTDSDFDTTYDNALATSIKLSDGTSVVDGEGSTVSDDIVTISAEGVYVISGTLSDGQIVIDSDEQTIIHIILNNVTISSSNSAPIYVRQADKVFVTLQGSNKLTTIKEYEADGETNIDGVIFSQDDITINGDGELLIEGPGNGIVSKDDLCLVGINLNVDVVNHGLEANDIIKIHSGSYTVLSDDDCFNSSNDDDTSLGSIYVLDGDFDLTSSDDCLNASSSITIEGGQFELDALDDAVHSDSELTINGGKISAIACYEGLESGDIVINDGEIGITAQDDGINVSGGNDSSGFKGGQDQFATASGNLTINGGTINVTASGDGLDSNGGLTINGGQVYVTGPTNSGNGVLDYTSEGSISSGNIIAIGASGMDQTLSSTNQGVIYYQFSSSYQSGSSIEIFDSVNQLIDSYVAGTAFNMIVLSNSQLTTGNTYTLVIDNDEYSIELESLSYGTPNSQGGQRSMNSNYRKEI